MGMVAQFNRRYEMRRSRKTSGSKAAKPGPAPKKQKPMLSREQLDTLLMEALRSKKREVASLAPGNRRSTKRKAKKQNDSEVEVLVTETWEQRNVKNMQAAKANGNFVELTSDDDAQNDKGDVGDSSISSSSKEHTEFCVGTKIDIRGIVLHHHIETDQYYIKFPGSFGNQ